MPGLDTVLRTYTKDPAIVYPKLNTYWSVGISCNMIVVKKLIVHIIGICLHVRFCLCCTRILNTVDIFNVELIYIDIVSDDIHLLCIRGRRTTCGHAFRVECRPIDAWKIAFEPDTIGYHG